MVLYTLYFKLEFGFDDEGIVTLGTILLISESISNSSNFCLINNINIEAFVNKLAKITKQLVKSNGDLISDYLDSNKVEILPFYGSQLGPILKVKLDINEDGFTARFKGIPLFKCIKKFFRTYLLNVLNDNLIQSINKQLAKSGKSKLLSSITSIKLIDYCCNGSSS